MAKKPPDAPPAKVALYDRLIATQPAIERKGAANAYTSLNGHMFSYLSKEGRLALRLPAAAREAFLKKYKTRLSVAYDTVMKEYVDVPDTLFEKTTEIKKHFAASVEYVSSLKPKPTTRKKPAGKTAKKKTAKKKTVTKKAATKTATKKTGKKAAARKTPRKR